MGTPCALIDHSSTVIALQSWLSIEVVLAKCGISGIHVFLRRRAPAGMISEAGVLDWALGGFTKRKRRMIWVPFIAGIAMAKISSSIRGSNTLCLLGNLQTTSFGPELPKKPCPTHFGCSIFHFSTSAAFRLTPGRSKMAPGYGGGGGAGRVCDDFGEHVPVHQRRQGRRGFL